MRCNVANFAVYAATIVAVPGKEVRIIVEGMRELAKTVQIKRNL